MDGAGRGRVILEIDKRFNFILFGETRKHSFAMLIHAGLKIAGNANVKLPHGLLAMM
jgi:hypothetical protein